MSSQQLQDTMKRMPCRIDDTMNEQDNICLLDETIFPQDTNNAESVPEDIVNPWHRLTDQDRKEINEFLEVLNPAPFISDDIEDIYQYKNHKESSMALVKYLKIKYVIFLSFFVPSDSC